MKYFTVFCLICILGSIHGQRHVLRDRIRSTLLPPGIGALCASESGANEEDIAEILSQKLPSRREGKCLVACIFEHLGISEDSLRTRLEDVAFGFLNHLKELNSPLYDTSMQIVLNCGSKMYSSKSTDPCDVALEIMNCGLQEGLTNGIENVFGTLIATNRGTLFPDVSTSITRSSDSLFPDLRRLDVLRILN